jgi:ElaA protein
MELSILKKTFKELTNQELYEILDLRSKVFVMEQKIMYVDTDYLDQECLHYMIYDDDILVSYLRVIPKGIKYIEYSFGRVATLYNYRKQGLSSKLIKEVIKDLKGFDIKISAQSYLKSYYEKFGFTVLEDEYLEENIPHLKMLLINN